MKKFIILINILLLTIFTMTGCGSFDESKIKGSLNNYFNWFEDAYEKFENLDKDNSDNKSENSNENLEVSINLDKITIVF